MNFAPRFTGPLAVLTLAGAAAAQGFSFPNFASTTGLTLNGAAAQSGTFLRVTNNGAAQTGSVWYTAPVPVTEGFETVFEFVVTATCEGLAFVIQGSPSGPTALGGSLWGVGYGFGNTSNPIGNSIAIEIDAVQEGFLNDTGSNELSVHTVGAFGNSENEGVSIGRATPSVDLSNGAPHSMRVGYVPGVGGAPGVLEIYVDGQPAPVLSMPFSFENGGTQLTGGSTGGLGLAGPDAWVGFTSSTASGSSGQNAEVRSWSWTSFQLPPACYTGNVLLGSGGPYDLLTINGGTGGFFRNVRLAFADPFTLAVDPPPGVATAPFLLLATIGIASPATVTTTPWGDACFPLIFPIDLGGAAAPVAVPVPPGILLPGEMTLQALMATDPLNPNVIELTNAIGLQFALAPAPTISTVLPGSTAPGGTITVTGNNFSMFATLDINGVPVAPTSLSPQQITFAMPASVPCDATLRIRNPDGAEVTRTFNPSPAATSQINTSGPASGGTSLIVIGTGFAAGCTATVGGNPANVTNSGATIVILSTPPGTPGPKPVVITTPGGCTFTTTFTYL